MHVKLPALRFFIAALFCTWRDSVDGYGVIRINP